MKPASSYNGEMEINMKYHSRSDPNYGGLSTKLQERSSERRNNASKTEEL